MRAFFNDGIIIEGHRSAVKRAIAYNRKTDPNIRVKFSGPFSELEQALYDLRSGNIKWFWENYDMETITRALEIETRVRYGVGGVYA